MNNNEKNVEESADVANELEQHETFEDLAAFEERASEPNLIFEEVIEELKKRGKL